MNTKLLLLVASVFSMLMWKVLCTMEDGPVFAADSNFMRVHRNLLQVENDEADEDEEISDGETPTNKVEEEKQEPEKKKGLFEKGVDLTGIWNI